MNTLRKIFMVVICAVLTANTAMAASEWKVGFNSECYREKKKAGASNVYYYYCGKQNPNGSCKGLVRTKSMNPEDFKHGDKQYLDGAWRICCHGTSSVRGKWVTGNEQKTYYDKTIDVGSGGGTCTYKITHDICDDEDTGTPCTVPDKCPSGKILRNNDCATLCPSGQGFQSTTSNTCIACSGTDRGVDTNKVCVVCTGGQKWNGTRCEAPKEETCASGQGKDSSGKCVACSGEDKGVDASGNCKTCSSGQVWDSGTKACKDKPQEAEPESEETEPESEPETTECKSTEYLSPKSGKCVSKSASKQYSRDMFDSCYACPTDTRFKSCLDFFRNPPTKLRETDKKVLTACNIDPSQYDSDAAGKSKFRLIDKLGKLGGKGKTSSVPAKADPGNSLQQSAYRDNVATAVDYEF